MDANLKVGSWILNDTDDHGGFEDDEGGFQQHYYGAPVSQTRQSRDTIYQDQYQPSWESSTVNRSEGTPSLRHRGSHICLPQVSIL